MSGCCNYDLESEFTPDVVARDLEAYRANGVPAVTARVVDELVARGVDGLTLLDIGGGVGAIHHELIRAGVRDVTDVDGSSAYLVAAREEARRRGNVGRISYRHADFVRVAEDVDPADIVTLIGVVCCYPRMELLVAASAAHARRYLALVYPRSTWWMRAAAGVYRLLRPLVGAGPGFVHDEREVDALVQHGGLALTADRSTWFWKVVLYQRPAPVFASAT